MGQMVWDSGTVEGGLMKCAWDCTEEATEQRIHAIARSMLQDDGVTATEFSSLQNGGLK